MLAENVLMMDDEGFSDKEVRDLQEGNLIPKGSYVVEIAKVEFDNTEASYTPKDENGNPSGPPITYTPEQHVSGYIQLRVADGLNNSQVGRRVTNFMRFFSPSVVPELPVNLRRMHDSTMQTIVQLVNASQVEVLTAANGNKQYLRTFLTGLLNDPPLIVRASVGVRPGQNGEPQNTVGGFRAYRG